jgi:hypothetical protein
VWVCGCVLAFPSSHVCWWRGQVSASDKEKIAALSCFDLDLKVQWREALFQANVLFRYFVSTYLDLFDVM